MMEPSKETVEADPPPEGSEQSYVWFQWMTRRPWNLLFMTVLPVLWIVFTAVGWSQEDRVETEVNNIWTQQRSSYAKDKEYADSLGRGDLGSTSFAALAVARDGDNLFEPARLETIRQRMEKTESTKASTRRLALSTCMATSGSS